MSTSFGDFQAEDDNGRSKLSGRKLYFTTSQGSGNTYLCGEHDSDIIAMFSRKEARQMLVMLQLAVEYAGDGS